MKLEMEDEEACPLTGSNHAPVGDKKRNLLFGGFFASRKFLLVALTAACGVFFISQDAPSKPVFHETIKSNDLLTRDNSTAANPRSPSSTTTPLDTGSNNKAVGSASKMIQGFKRGYDDLHTRLTERYGEFYKPIFFDSDDVPRGRYVFESGDGISTLSRDRFRRKLKLKLLEYLTTGSAHFVWATGGHSAAAGHGNFYDESYTSYLEQAVKPVFEAVGLQFTGRNYAMGSTASAPESALCNKEIYGQDIDALVW